MSILKNMLIAVLFAGFLACNSTDNAANTTQTTLIDEADSVADDTPARYTEEQRESIVNKGGPTASDQLILEEQLDLLASNQIDYQGTPFEKLIGHWVGTFGKNKINITLTSINESDKTVTGYSVCAGNFRSLSGAYLVNENAHAFILNEPGDDPYDGKFEFTIQKGSNELSGSWTPFKKEGNSAKKYTLEHRDFVYDETNGQFEASSRYFEYEEVQNQADEDLTLMRNEIYARHGYCFKDKDMRYHFEQQDWYMPMGVDIRHELTDIEIANIALIYEYEQYYEEYSDDYGR